ncbi:acyl-CoA dehydrogenase family protein [Burkholderia thailandensis]|uniref:acyl-CoA dehydrogenase family protein n=1 Tax=Burkholderia thailandensis TaxID=57975 RepID=UPI00192D94F5|nr:acyl-CoA dehydrogenase family protein [Burkholderia thailandensis]MBS2126741.1 acyl-CoA dehydrogenase family protein [Burkholderia thailandensis]QRA09791.1 acyl-CoA dehydrogenase family protein [Burkholderia thailandensis]
MIERVAAFRDVEAALAEPEAALAAGDFAAVERLMAGVRAANRARGLWLPQAPRADGGMGLSLLELVEAGEILGRSPLGHYAVNYQAPDTGNIEVLFEYGTAAQQARWLAPLLRGEIRSCFAATEPDSAGSNPASLKSRAVFKDGAWHLSGRKWFASGADQAAFAIVLAVTDETAPLHARTSTFIVPADAPGYRHVRNLRVMGDEGCGWASHGELELDDCRVGEDALLGKPGEGFIVLQARLATGRLHHCARWIGVCERAFAIMCRRACRRELAAGELLSSRHTVQNWIAESRASIDAARLLVTQAASRLQSRHERAQIDISIAKFFVAGVTQTVLDHALQVQGALGVSGDTILNVLWRHERAGRIYDGPDEVHKALVARHALAAFRGEAR